MCRVCPCRRGRHVHVRRVQLRVRLRRERRCGLSLQRHKSSCIWAFGGHKVGLTKDDEATSNGASIRLPAAAFALSRAVTRLSLNSGDPTSVPPSAVDGAAASSDGGTALAAAAPAASAGAASSSLSRAASASSSSSSASCGIDVIKCRVQVLDPTSATQLRPDRHCPPGPPATAARRLSPPGARPNTAVKLWKKAERCRRHGAIAFPAAPSFLQSLTGPLTEIVDSCAMTTQQCSSFLPKYGRSS